MIVYCYEILYTLFNIIISPHLTLFIRCKADVFIVYGCFIAQYSCVVVVLTSVMGWVCLDKLFDL